MRRLRSCTGVVRGEVCRLKAPYTSAKAMNWQYLLKFPKATLVFHSAQWARAELVEHEQMATRWDLFANGSECSPPVITAKKWALSVTTSMDLLVLHHRRLRDHGVQAPT